MVTKPNRRRATRGTHKGVKLMRLADGRWVARWVDPLSGKQQQQGLELLGLTNVDTRRRWAEQKAQQIAGLRAGVATGNVVATRKPLAEAAAEWLAGYPHKATAASYSMLLGRFTAWAERNGVRAVQDLAQPHLAAYRDAYRKATAYAPAVGKRQGAKGETKRRRKPSSVNLAFTVVRMFVGWARRRGWVPNLDAESVATALQAVKAPRGEIEFLRPPQIRQLLEAAQRHDRHAPDNPRHKAAPIAPFVLGVLLTGCRFAELAGLRWDEVDLAAGELRLPASRVKTASARTVRLDVSPTMLDLLKRLSLRRVGDLVFGLERGHAEFARGRLMRVFDAPTFTWHGLRRTASAVLTCAPGIYGGAAAFMAAKRAGHSVVIAEKLYAGVLPNLPASAKCIEDAADFRNLADAIVAAAGGDPLPAAIDDAQAFG